MKALILGASGMVGTEVIHQILQDEKFDKVYSICRSVSPLISSKLEQIVHKNYEDYSELSEVFSEADICFYCVGVYQGQVTKQEFWTITVNYLDSLISELVETNKEITLCLFSAQGASPDEKSVFLFGNAKGRAEKRLTDSKIKYKFIFRPGFINPGRISAMSGITLKLYQLLYRVLPAIGIDAVDLARLMISVGTKGSSKIVFSNADMRKLIAMK